MGLVPGLETWRSTQEIFYLTAKSAFWSLVNPRSEMWGPVAERREGNGVWERVSPSQGFPLPSKEGSGVYFVCENCALLCTFTHCKAFLSHSTNQTKHRKRAYYEKLKNRPMSLFHSFNTVVICF